MFLRFSVDYRRSAGAMAVIAMCLSPLAIGFGAYCIKEARYMFRRVASAVHLITGELNKPRALRSSCSEAIMRRGVVVSGVRRMNEVNARRALLVPGWVTVFGRVYHLGM